MMIFFDYDTELQMEGLQSVVVGALNERFEQIYRALINSGIEKEAVSVGSKKKVDELTEKFRIDGYDVLSGPRTTGDGYYESCVIGIEENQIEITV